jgi:FlaG/FlaF family flagellin (archaellin)
MPLPRRAAGPHRPAPPSIAHARPCLEELETRLVPYTTSGAAWPHPEVITLSFVPDGTVISSGTGGTVVSNLFARFNARWPTATWQGEVIKAAQVWSQYANINFDVVSDNGTTSGQGAYQQGDPAMGDLRIGGYGFSNNSYLGMAYMPPPLNNFSLAGDLAFNTNQSFNIGTTYDLETVALHEIGHALGLYHSTTGGAVMYPSYSGTKRALTSDDINGIRAIYGARQPDAYDGGGQNNNSFATATNISSLIDPTRLTAQVNNLDIGTYTSSGGLLGGLLTLLGVGGALGSDPDADFFTFTAPANSGPNLTISVQSAGLSLLRPDVTVYAADQSTVLGWVSAGTANDGTTQTMTISGVTPGQRFYVQILGADSTPFGTGKYALTLGLGASPLPSVPLPNTQLLDGSPIVGGGGQNYEGYSVDFYAINDKVEHDHGHAGSDDRGQLPDAIRDLLNSGGLVAKLLSAHMSTITHDLLTVKTPGGSQGISPEVGTLVGLILQEAAAAGKAHAAANHGHSHHQATTHKDALFEWLGQHAALQPPSGPLG